MLVFNGMTRIAAVRSVTNKSAKAGSNKNTKHARSTVSATTESLLETKLVDRLKLVIRPGASNNKFRGNPLYL